LTILSTVAYVTQIASQTPKIQATKNNQFEEYRHNLRNTLISSLANITNSGNNQIINTNINKLNTIMRTHFYQSIFQIDNILENVAPYQNGVWISWDQISYGVSAVATGFTIKSMETIKTSDYQDTITIITEVRMTGSYNELTNTTKEANLLISLENEGEPALASNMAFFYQKNNEWIQADTVNITNFGNGTYSVSFIAQQNLPSDPLDVLIQCTDERGITVKTTTRCASS
jgi:hypothetical protein